MSLFLNFNYYTMKKHLAFFLSLGLLMTANVMFAQPANDDCSGAIALTVAPDEASATPLAGTTTGATASTSPTSVCSGSWFGDDVWYSFTTGATVPANGVTLKVTPSTGSIFQPLGMAIYLGCGANEVPIACMSQTADDFLSLPFLQANTTYYVRMWSGGSATNNSGAFDIIVYENFVDPNQVVDVVLWGNNPGEGDFNGGLNGWTSNAISTGDDWVWEADASANGAFRSNTIVSPTAFNGAMLFDADFMTTSVNPAPTQPYPQHTAELLSPIIDCSNMPTLSVKFYQSYEALNGDCFFSYSIDGGQTFSAPINVNGDIAGNDGTPSPSVKRYDMPGADGSSQVQLKFTADMDFYNWIIDDVQLVKKEGNNLTLANDFIAIAPIYAMPKSSVDTVRFLADVANNGANDATNVVLSVDVVKNSDNSTVFSATNPYGTMMAGDTVENQTFTAVFVPDTIVESYTVTYTLSSDSIDAIPGDNTFSYQFEVVEDYFDRMPAPTRNITPGGDNSFTYGSSFYVFNGTEVGGNNNLDTLYREVTAVTFGAANTDELAGESVTIFIEKPISGNQFNVNPADGSIGQGDRQIVGFGTYTFTGNEPANSLINVPIEDFNTGEILELESDMNYAVMMNYVASSTTINLFMLAGQGPELNYSAADFAAAQNGVQRFSELLDVGNSGAYSTFGFVGSPVPFVRLNFLERFATSTESAKLDANTLTVFPNPADEFITATIDLEEMSANVRLTIYNVTGQVVETRNLGNVTNEQVLFNLADYTSGTYYMSVETEAGHSIKRFVVSK
jgi:hypothetical protein